LGVIYKKHRRQTLHELITGFIGLDAHAESIAIAVAEVGRECKPACNIDQVRGITGVQN
jgi:hypothetical protein